MSDLPKAGDRVVCMGASNDQVAYGSGDDPRTVLALGGEYTIEVSDVYDWHTLVKLEGVQGRFNSVCFAPTKDPTND